eukprot:TRINITY_DN6167_c1_g1_i1.p1 TRINITY_DN6167_c1_g1~~TRINITY_DN6167_c1_g1_i1.p1  ORF type:complete len:198 (-),score=80.07 TRINITY_DN6167_c1_g1_i1:34-588(-)
MEKKNPLSKAKGEIAEVVKGYGSCIHLLENFTRDSQQELANEISSLFASLQGLRGMQEVPGMLPKEVLRLVDEEIQPDQFLARLFRVTYEATKQHEEYKKAYEVVANEIRSGMRKRDMEDGMDTVEEETLRSVTSSTSLLPGVGSGAFEGSMASLDDSLVGEEEEEEREPKRMKLGEVDEKESQ